MKKKRSTKLINAGDILLTIICLIGMAVALYLFWADLNVSLSKQDEAPIAVVYFKQNTVQRRMVDRNIWERVQTSALVYEGDRIRTSEMSEAVTVFADGTEIEIHENTLIQIYTQKEKAAIDFIRGAITASASIGSEDEAQVLVKTGEKVVELGSGAVTAIAAPVSSSNRGAVDETVAVTVTKGTASVRDAQATDSYQSSGLAGSVVNAVQNGIDELGASARQMLAAARTAAGATVSEQLTAPKQVVQAGEVSFVKTAEETASAVTVEDRAATIYLPLSSTVVRVEKNTMPVLMTQWESNADLTFEFARDASFAKPLFSRTYPSYQSQSYISLEGYADPGSLFWRAFFTGDPDSIFAMGIVLIQNAPEESAQEMLDRVLNDENGVPLKDEPDTQEEAIKAEAIRKEEEERRAREEAARLDAERERQRIEAEKAAEEARLAEERRLAEEAAAQEAAARKAEEDRIAAEKAEEERLEAEREAAERALTERRLAAARAAEEKRLAAEKAAAEKAAAEKAAAERKAAADKAAAEKKLAEEQAARERAAEEARLAQKREAERIIAEEQARIAAEKAAAEEAARKAEEARLAEEKRRADEAEAAERARALAAQRQTFAASITTLRDPAGGKVLDDAFFDTNRSLNFAWTPIADAASYELIIKQKGVFSKTILDRTVSNTQYTLRTLSDLEEGDFEWSVVGIMSDGTKSRAATGSFSVKLEPLDDIELDLSDLFHR